MRLRRDGERARLKVDVRPGEAQELALAHARGDRQLVERLQAVPLDGLEERPRLLLRQRLHLLGGGVGSRTRRATLRGTSSWRSASLRAERSTERTKRRQWGRSASVWKKGRVDHEQLVVVRTVRQRVEEGLQVAHGQPIEAARSQAGDELHLDDVRVAAQGAGAQAFGRDVLQPVAQPLLHGQVRVPGQAAEAARALPFGQPVPQERLGFGLRAVDHLGQITASGAAADRPAGLKDARPQLADGARTGRALGAGAGAGHSPRLRRACPRETAGSGTRVACGDARATSSGVGGADFPRILGNSERVGGEPRRTRTYNRLIKSQLLFQLS